MSWSAKLAKPLKPRNHAELRTLGNARDYMLKLPDAVASWQAWLHAGDLLLAAAKHPTDDAIAEVTDQIDRALFLTYREDMTALPPSKP
jgi:hypothetical protein